MSDKVSLSDFIDACLGQNLPKEELVDFYEKSVHAVTRKLEEEDPCASVPPANLDQGLHIASIFIVLFASSAGVAFPLLAKYHKKLNIHHYYVVLGKCAGTGVLLSCALVHMILPSNEALTSECVTTFFNTDYPAMAFVVALAAILAMHAFEAFLTSFLTATPSVAPVAQLDEDSNPGLVIEGGDPLSIQEKEGKRQDDDTGDQMFNAKQISEAYMIEFGIAVHSVFIGLAVGVSGRDKLLALLVALVFHQLFEGVSLGSRLADTTLGVWHEVILGGLFAVSAPIGIAIGMGVYRSILTDMGAFLVAQGFLDGVCGGILLYTGFTFLLEDFGRDMELYCRGKHQRLMQTGMFITLWMFAGLMSLIGKYL